MKQIRDEALPKAIAYLRSKGLFPEADSDSDSSDFIMGDGSLLFLALSLSPFLYGWLTLRPQSPDTDFNAM